MKCLKESIEEFCPGCHKSVELDQNGLCPDCGTELLSIALGNIKATDSNYYLVFENTSNGKYATKIDLNRPNSSINTGAVAIQVTKSFFDQLTPQVHDETPNSGYCGGVIISKESPSMQQILNSLNSLATKLTKPLGKIKQTNAKKSKDNGQISIFDSLAAEVRAYETLWD